MEATFPASEALDLGLSQPTATVSAALIAVLAAVIALFGVRITVAATRKQHERTLEVEAQNRRRNEAVELLTDGLSAMMDVWASVGAAHSDALGLDPPDIGEWSDQQVRSALGRCTFLALKMDLLGLSEAQSSIEDYIKTMRDVWTGLRVPGPVEDFASAWASLEETKATFRLTISNLENPGGTGTRSLTGPPHGT